MADYAVNKYGMTRLFPSWENGFRSNFPSRENHLCFMVRLTYSKDYCDPPLVAVDLPEVLGLVSKASFWGNPKGIGACGSLRRIREPDLASKCYSGVFFAGICLAKKFILLTKGPGFLSRILRGRANNNSKVALQPQQ